MKTLLVAVVAVSWLRAAAADAQEASGTCARLARDVLAAGATTAREERLLAACPDTAPLLRFSRAAGPLELIARAQALDSARSRSRPFQSSGHWASLWFNSERAAGADRPGVWSGRGLSIAASAGGQGRAGPLSYSAMPVIFWSENRPYTPSSSSEPIGFQNPWFPGVIDAPYRFGGGGYGRLDAGASFLRVDVARLAAGISNLPQSWGPARLHPLVLGRETGFPHIFLESALPLDVGIGAISGRWLMGRLASSTYGRAHAAPAQRVAVGMVGVFTPAGLSGLEVGGTRFFSFYETPGAFSFSNALLPLSGLVKTRSALEMETNQVASVFARIAPPSAPVEVYGEFFRDDHAWDLRDLIGEPDHGAAWVMGLSWQRRDDDRDRLDVLTVERLNSRATHLRRVRQQLPLYTHHAIVEGHTQRGLMLGSPATPGGGALSVVFDRRGPSSGWSVIAEMVHDAQGPAEGATWLGEPAGHFSVGVAREIWKRGRWWTMDMRAQPGFGDVPGTNVRVMLSVEGPGAPWSAARDRTPSAP